MPEISEAVMIAQVEQRLASKYADLPKEEISAVVRNVHATFEHSKIRDFVPLFVERNAAARLSQAR